MGTITIKKNHTPKSEYELANRYFQENKKAEVVSRIELAAWERQRFKSNIVKIQDAQIMC
jgi:hypothetical protein